MKNLVGLSLFELNCKENNNDISPIHTVSEKPSSGSLPVFSAHSLLVIENLLF